jgi:WD40 repeat protein
LKGRVLPRALTGAPDVQLAAPPSDNKTHYRIFGAPIKNAEGYATGQTEWQLQSFSAKTDYQKVVTLPENLMRGSNYGNAVYAVSPDGTVVALGAEEDSPTVESEYGVTGVVRIWDVRNARVMRVLRQPERVAAIQFSPDGKMLITMGRQARFWNWRSGVLHYRWLAGNSGIAFSNDGSRVALSVPPSSQGGSRAAPSPQPFIQFRDLKTGKLVGTLNSPPATYDYGGAPLAFSPDGRSLAAIHNGLVEIWELSTKRLRRAFRPPEWESAAGIVFAADALYIGGLRWSLNWLRVPFHDISVRTIHFPAPRQQAVALQFGRDGNSISLRVGDVTRSWIWRTGKPLKVPKLILSQRHKTTIAKDRKSVRLEDGKLRRYMADVGEGEFLASALSPNGKTVAGASTQGFVHLWDAGSGALLRNLSGHTGAVTALAYSPDGKTLASGSEDDTIRLWDAQNGAPLKVLEGQVAVVRALAFSPDGKFLAGAGDNGTIKIWRVP